MLFAPIYKSSSWLVKSTWFWKKKTISEKLPVYWEQQFKSWQLNAVKVVANKTIQVFQIPPDEKNCKG